MNVQLDKQPNGTAYVTVTVEPADYEEDVKKELKKIRKEINLPGFRPGNVPQQIINKKYGKSVLAETTSKKSYDIVENYIKDENIITIGDCIPSEKQTELDFDNSTSFDFMYKIGIIPEFDSSVSEQDVIEKIIFTPTEKIIKEYKENLLSRYAELKDTEEVEEKGVFSADISNGEISVEGIDVSMVSIKEDAKKQFLGKKVGDSIDININDVFSTKHQIASNLSIKEEELENVKPEFTFTVKSVRHFVNPELNDEFFARAYPEKDVTTIEQFDEKILQEINKIFEGYSANIFEENIIKYFAEKAKIVLPVEFLKEWMFLVNEGKVAKEDIDKEYPQYARMFEWGQIKKAILKANDRIIGKEDILNAARKRLLSQYQQYGITIPEEYLNNMVEEYLKNSKDDIHVIYEEAENIVVFDIVSGKVTVNEKKMSTEEYQEIVKQNNDAKQEETKE